jgi:hypothetical protein
LSLIEYVKSMGEKPGAAGGNVAVPAAPSRSEKR